MLDKIREQEVATVYGEAIRDMSNGAIFHEIKHCTLMLKLLLRERSRRIVAGRGTIPPKARVELDSPPLEEYMPSPCP